MYHNFFVDEIVEFEWATLTGNIDCLKDKVNGAGQKTHPIWASAVTFLEPGPKEVSHCPASMSPCILWTERLCNCGVLVACWVWGEEKNKHARTKVENNTGSRDSSKLLQQLLWKRYFISIHRKDCVLWICWWWILMANWGKGKHALELSIQKDQWYVFSYVLYLSAGRWCFIIDVTSTKSLLSVRDVFFSETSPAAAKYPARLYCWIWHVLEKVKFVLEIIKFSTKCLLQSKKQVLHGVIGLSLGWTEQLIAIPVPGGGCLNTQLFRCRLLCAKVLY